MNKMEYTYVQAHTYPYIIRAEYMVQVWADKRNCYYAYFGKPPHGTLHPRTPLFTSFEGAVEYALLKAEKHR